MSSPSRWQCCIISYFDKQREIIRLIKSLGIANKTPAEEQKHEPSPKRRIKSLSKPKLNENKEKVL